MYKQQESRIRCISTKIEHRRGHKIWPASFEASASVTSVRSSAAGVSSHPWHQGWVASWPCSAAAVLQSLAPSWGPEQKGASGVPQNRGFSASQTETNSDSFHSALCINNESKEHYQSTYKIEISILRHFPIIRESGLGN